MIYCHSMADEALKADFCIEIDFKKESEAPSRVFRALSDLIDAFHSLDIDLAQSVDSQIEPILLLEDIQIGSIKTWLRYILNAVEDDALKNLDWKPAVGKYLVKAKYLMINFLSGKTEITDRKQIEYLNGELLKLAQDTNVRHIPAYSPLPPQKLLQHIEQMTLATTSLTEEDKVRYITKDEEIPFNLSFRIVPEAIEDLLTRETIESTLEMILKVKKPDYLGESKWEFRHENRTIHVKILDAEWLADFQTRKVDVRPGDSIRAKVRIITKYGYDFNVVSIHYEIKEVLAVIPFITLDQNSLFE